MMFDSERGKPASQAASGKPASFVVQCGLKNFVTELRRRRYGILMRWFDYWVLCRSPMSDSPDFKIIDDNEGIPIYSQVSVSVAT